MKWVQSCKINIIYEYFVFLCHKMNKMITLKSTLEELNALNKGTLMERLGIEYLEIGEGFMKGKMPVDNRTKQPFNNLHGGASIAFAESIASLGSVLLVDQNKYDVRGASVTANHIGAISSGNVYGVARLIHRGSITHVWDVEILDEDQHRISVSRVTVVVIPKQIKNAKIDPVSGL